MSLHTSDRSRRPDAGPDSDPDSAPERGSGTVHDTGRRPHTRQSDPNGSRPRLRLVLAAVGLFALAALAGCSAPGSIALTPVDDVGLAHEASHTVNAEDVPAEDEAARIVREAVDDGSTTATGQHPPAETRDGPYPYRYDGGYYELNYSVVDEEPVYGVSIDVDYNASDLDGADAVRVADLPAADRRALSPLVPPETDRRTDGYDFGASATYTVEEASASTLVDPDAESPTEYVIAHEGERYRIRVSPPREGARFTYRYTATTVAPSDEAYARSLREQYLFELDGLSQAERDVLSTATDETYYADGSDDEAFGSLVDRFRAHDAPRSDEYQGEWIVRWDGQVYWADLRYQDY